jgi:hypothetical protein
MSKFGEAFKKARKAGKKTFSFNGKSYTTKTKEEAEAPKPARRSMKHKVKVPTGPEKTKLKGKVGDLPSKKKEGQARVADAKVKADAAREEMTKKSKGKIANMSYARRVTGRKTW